MNFNGSIESRADEFATKKGHPSNRVKSSLPDLNALTWMNRIDRIWEYDPKDTINKEISVLKPGEYGQPSHDWTYTVFAVIYKSGTYIT